MASSYRRKKRVERYTPAEKQRYWDQKVLEEPDKLPSNYSYNVPEVPPLQPSPAPKEFGLNESVTEVVRYYRDRNASKPRCFDGRTGRIFSELMSTALGTALVVGVLALVASMSRKPSPAVEVIAALIAIAGGITCLILLWQLVATFLAARLARSNFENLSPTSGPSQLLNGKTLVEAEHAFDIWQLAVDAHKAEHQQKCEARMAEIWRRHRSRVEKLMAARELERAEQEQRARVARIEHENMMANRELQRLQNEEKARAAQFERENFARLAMTIEYWTAGVTTEEKGRNLETRFGILLEGAGFSVQFTPQTGDDGVDIKATKDGERIVVQCKNYAAKVGAGEIRDFAGALKYERESFENTIGWLVAPNGFSESTFQKFHRPGDVELLEFEDIRRLVIKTYHKGTDFTEEDIGPR